MENPEDIVICGMSGKLPQSDNLEEFWDNLYNGRDMVTESYEPWMQGIAINISNIRDKCWMYCKKNYGNLFIMLL